MTIITEVGVPRFVRPREHVFDITWQRPVDQPAGTLDDLLTRDWLAGGR